MTIFLLKYNKLIEEKFNKICEDLLCVGIICDLGASDNVECFVCCTKDMEEAYIPESVLVKSL